MSSMPATAMDGLGQLSDPFLHPFSLKKAFGKRWKILREESWAHEKPENKTGYEGWYEQVPTTCGGFIGLFQDKPTVILQFYTFRQRPTCRKLAEAGKATRFSPDLHGSKDRQNPQNEAIATQARGLAMGFKKHKTGVNGTRAWRGFFRADIDTENKSS